MSPRSSRRWPGRLAVGAGVVVLVLLLALTAAAALAVRAPYPAHDGTLTLAALDTPVEVLRDDRGVPHIYARTSADLYRAQGYVHAQDRFWQMDVWRHIGAGRTAELFGPDQLPNDRFLRTLGWARLAAEEYVGARPETRAMLDAYAEGVNAYLDERGPRGLGLHYSVLGLRNRGYEPEPWQPVHSLTFLKLMAWDLRGNLEREIERAVLGEQLDADLLGALYPPYPADRPVIVDGETAGPRTAATPGLPAVGGILETLADQLAAVDALVGPYSEGLGSNSWVVAGEHTDTGSPLLANDPHLAIQMPSIWYEVALHCDAPGCLPAAGFSFAGLPAVVAGHNGTVAWGVTNLGADVTDLFVERVDPEDPDRYELEGEWVEMEVHEETLVASDGTTERLRVRRTGNGPVISGLFGPADEIDPAAVADDGHEYVLALAWTALEAGPTIDALPLLNGARGWDDFREAAARFVVPAQNLVYADVDGNIGYQAPGHIPIRASGDGTVPVPGWTGDHAWVDTIPFDELPSVLNPEDGWLVTANNRVVDDDYPHLLTRDWDYGDRADRISTLLEEAERPLSLDDLQAMQGDNHDPSAEWLVPAVAALDGDDAVALVQELLAGWDRQMDADSAPAAAYAATWRHLLARTFHSRLPERWHPAGNSRWMEVLRRLLDEPSHEWWDDPTTAGRELRDDALRDAVQAAVAELEERLGADPDGWRWGDLHGATFRDGTLGQSGSGLVERGLNRGPYPADGGSAIVNAVGWDASQGYEVVALPSMRMLVDLDDLDRSRGIHSTGQSGHPYHRHYTDMIEPWMVNEQHPLPWTRPAVEAVAESRLRLEP